MLIVKPNQLTWSAIDRTSRQRAGIQHVLGAVARARGVAAMNVWIVDLLAQTPFYDRALAQAIAPLVDHLTLYTTRFHLEPDYFEAVPFERSPGLTEWVSRSHIENRPLRRMGRIVEYALNSSYLSAMLGRRPPDIVHMQWLPLLSWTTWDLGAIAAIQRHHIPVIYTIHNYMPHEKSPRHRERYLRAYKMVDHLMVHTLADRDQLLRDFGSTERVSVIPQGPVFTEQPPPSRAQARAALGLSDGEFVFLMLGVIRPYKGIDHAVEALAEVGKKQRCRLVVAGPMLDTEYLQAVKKRAMELDIGDRIDWHLGYVHSSQVGMFHAAADVVLFPYREISQSAAFLTAAGFASCTLTTRVGGLAELTEDGVTTVQIAEPDPPALAAGMARCIALSPADRARMGRLLQAHVDSCCNWDLVARQTCQMYRQVLDRRQGSAHD